MTATRARTRAHSRAWARPLVAALAGALLLSGCDFDGAYDLPLPGSPVDADDSYEVTAEFADILNVVPRSPVMVDDVTVGEVTEVERVGWHAEITLRVRDDVELPANAIADIRQVSLLGEKYVALEEPTGEPPTGRLGDGDVIGLEATGRNPEVEEVLGALSFLLSGGGVAQLGTITRELNQVMSGRTNNLRSLLRNLDAVVGTLDAQKGDIITALEAMNRLTGTLNAQREVITDAIDATGPAVRVLAEQQEELVTMLTDLQELGQVGTRVIRASREDLLDSLRDLQPVLNRLSASGDSLAPGLNLLLSFPFPQEASEVVLGDYANTSIRFEVSLDNLFRGIGVPEIDLGDLTNGTPLDPLVDGVLDCLESGSLTSPACRRVLRSADLLGQLRQACQLPRYRRTPVCRLLGSGSVLGDLGTGLGNGLGNGLGDLLDGLGGATGGLGRAAASGAPTPPPDRAALLGGTS